MPAVRKYSLKGRLFQGQVIVGYTVQAPDGQRMDINMAQAIALAQDGMINHARAVNGKLAGDGIRLDNLPKKQV